MSTRKPLTLSLTTTDSAANAAVFERQVRDGTADQVPRAAVLSTRVSVRARDQLQALARVRRCTPSRLLSELVTTLAVSDIVAPTRAQVAALKAICEALELPADSDASSIRSALAALLEFAPPAPSPGADPLAATPDPVPAMALANPTQLSPADQKKWLDDRAAKRAARRAKTKAPGKISGR